jgi:hypothetical protein
LLHIDGSPHAWLTLRPAARSVLIAVLDDATKLDITNGYPSGDRGEL